MFFSAFLLNSSIRDGGEVRHLKQLLELYNQDYKFFFLIYIFGSVDASSGCIAHYSSGCTAENVPGSVNYYGVEFLNEYISFFFSLIFITNRTAENIPG